MNAFPLVFIFWIASEQSMTENSGRLVYLQCLQGMCFEENLRWNRTYEVQGQTPGKRRFKICFTVCINIKQPQEIGG